MFKFIRGVVILAIAALFVIAAFNAFAQEQKPVQVIAFHQEGCPHCAAQKEFFKNNLEKKYKVDVKIYEVVNNAANVQLFQALVAVYKQEITGVPMVFVGDKVFSGHDGNVELGIIAEVQRCLTEICQPPLERLKDFKPDQQPVSIDEKYKNIGYVVLGAIGVLIVVVVAFTVKPKKR